MMYTFPTKAVGAILSNKKDHRYVLWRSWAGRPLECKMVTWIMLNPSTADERYNDPTIQRCISFSQDWGFDGLIVVNLFSQRSTDPDNLSKSKALIGPLNRKWMLAAIQRSEQVILAWGTRPWLEDICVATAELVTSIMNKEHQVKVLGVCKDGEPRHPLYVRGAAQRVSWAGCNHLKGDD